VEHRLCLSANALTAAWKRLLLLAEAVRDQGAVLEEFELNKEREQVVGMVARMNEGQVSFCLSIFLIVKFFEFGMSSIRYRFAWFFVGFLRCSSWLACYICAINDGRSHELN
jgi:hypothetical protein